MRWRQTIFGILLILITGSVQAFPITSTEIPDNPVFSLTDIEKVLIPFSDDRPDEVINRLANSIDILSKKQLQYKNSRHFVEFVYNYVHRKYLKEYKTYSTLGETVSSGTYDCLTGTALYTLFFTELNIEHAIVETNHHIYILVYPGTEKEILLESTDPLHGFVIEPDEIELLKSQYAAGNNDGRKVQVKLDLQLNNYLEGQEIIGLLFYNQSIKYINQGWFDQARIYAEMALSYYAGNRITNLINWLNERQNPASI